MIGLPLFTAMWLLARDHRWNPHDLRWHAYLPVLKTSDLKIAGQAIEDLASVYGIPITLYPLGAKGEILGRSLVLENQRTGDAIILNPVDTAIVCKKWLLI